MSKLFMRPRLCHGWMDDKFHLILIVDLNDDQRGICLDIFPVGMCFHSFVFDQNEAFQFLQEIFLVSMVKVLIPASIDEDLIKDQELIPSWRKGFFNHLRVAASENYFFILENITFTFTFVGSR